MQRNHKVRSVLPEVTRVKVMQRAYQNLINKCDSNIAIQYLLGAKRGFREDQYQKVVTKYKLGYVPNHIRNQYNDPHQFAGRLTIPIFDQYDQLVALSSRDMRPQSKMKFFHESYNKSIYLYGLNHAKHSIVQQNKVIAVQGQFDTIFMQMNGFENTVGLLGSAIHLQQLSLLKRYCSQMYLLLDGDKAGKKAMMRSMRLYERLCQTNGLRLIPVYIPDGKDPDIYLRQNGKSAMIQLLNKSKEQGII